MHIYAIGEIIEAIKFERDSKGVHENDLREGRQN